jgi:fido (protein-threonine AMPylation protein)
MVFPGDAKFSKKSHCNGTALIISYSGMENQEKDKIKDLFFRLQEISGRHPGILNEVKAALRFHKVSNSSAIETKYIDPIFLQTALTNYKCEQEQFTSPVYRKAYLETHCHDQMLRHLEAEAEQKSELSVSFVLGLHRQIFEKSWPDIAGRFRDVDLRIKGSSHRPPLHQSLPELVYQHIAWLDGLIKLLGPVTVGNFYEIMHVVADAHFRMIWTYPFHDGNGRIARAVANYILLYCGLNYNIISFDRREEYFGVIEKSSMADFSPLEDFLISCYGQTLDRIANFFYMVDQTATEA